MSAIIQRVKETISPDERLKKQVKNALDIADRIIIEMRAQQVNIKKCCEFQEGMLAGLHKIMDGALKLGNRNLYMQTGKLAEVVGNWHSITKQMMSDESIMIQFISMIKTFYSALLEYKQIVKDFSKTSTDFVNLGHLGESIPKQLEVRSEEAARAFSQVTNQIGSMKMGYTGLTDFIQFEDDDKWSKIWDEERQRLSEKQHKTENNG